jgi:hypothetical protein
MNANQQKAPGGNGGDSWQNQPVNHNPPARRPQVSASNDHEYIGIDGLLSRLDGVKRTAPNKWIAKSPTRNERTASLSIRLTDDGRVLLHDFGGSDAGEILAALGMSWLELIPPHLRRDKRAITPAERQGHNAQAALNAIYGAAIITRLCANKLADGEQLTRPDHHALRQAQHDIKTAFDSVRGVPHG